MKGQLISDDVIAQFERDGAVCIRSAVDEDVAASVLANLDGLIADLIVNQDRVGAKPGDSPRNDEWFPKVWFAS